MNDWYCPTCGVYVENESVTNDERHELCGAALTSGPVDSPYRRALARVIDLERQVVEDETIIATLRDMGMDATERAEKAEADRDEWMSESDLNLRTLITMAGELAEFKSRHTGGGCGCDKVPERKGGES